MMIPDTMMIHVILLHFPIFIRFFFTRYNDDDDDDDGEKERAAAQQWQLGVQAAK